MLVLLVQSSLAGEILFAGFVFISANKYTFFPTY